MKSKKREKRTHFEWKIKRIHRDQEKKIKKTLSHQIFLFFSFFTLYLFSHSTTKWIIYVLGGKHKNLSPFHSVPAREKISFPFFTVMVRSHLGLVCFVWLHRRFLQVKMWGGGRHWKKWILCAFFYFFLLVVLIPCAAVYCSEAKIINKLQKRMFVYTSKTSKH